MAAPPFRYPSGLAFQFSRDQIGQRALRPQAIVFVGIDQQRADRGVSAVGLHLVQADPRLAGGVQCGRDARMP
jgi:hypothetical protein